jgi:oxygen-dependent protoporphyrinogen oxidase
MKSVAIIGAGIAGLTAAFYLKRKGVPVTVYEASGRVGGVIQSIRRDGYLAEFGPNTLLETSPKIAQFIRDAGLQSRRLDPDPKAGARYVVRYRRPVAMPGSPLGFFTTDLFSLRAKLAVLREPFVPRRRDGVEESIAQFVVRRFNQEFLDHAIDALVAGIYAGDPYKLSVQHAFPKLKALEDNYGSMIKGQIFGARERKRRGEVAKDRAPKFSFDEGLQVLPETLAAQLGDALHLKTAVTALSQTADGWRVTTSSGESEHRAVVFCGTAPRLADLEVLLSGRAALPRSLEGEAAQQSLAQNSDSLLPRPVTQERGEDRGEGNSEPERASSPRPSPPLHGGEGDKSGASQVSRQPEQPRPTGGEDTQRLDLSPFSEIRYPPVASVVLGFRREDVAHPCQGFGMLIPKIEGFKILGTIFSSALFPNRAPAGHLTLTSYVGGERYPELASLPPAKLYELTCDDLRVLLGVRGRPTFEHCVYYPRAIPQYNVGYGRYRDLMTEIEAKAPGLFLAGHYRDGISLSDTIVSGINVAERAAEAVKADNAFA